MMNKKGDGSMSKQPILEVKNLQKQFPIYGPFGKLAPAKQTVQAVNDVSISLFEGETYGLVGESGSGKSTTGRTILGLTKATSGEVLYKDEDLTKLSKSKMREFRKDLQFVFQDPFSSLNPRKRIGEILEEPLIIHKMGNKEERLKLIFDILESVGLQKEHFYRYPHEFSGGQRQRLSIARAFILDPKIVICDEPVSALDVSIQSQILNMLKDLQKQRRMTLLFISHDISVVRYISDRIGIMYLGNIVEEASTDQLFSGALHPYTQALFSAVPNRDKTQKITLKGEIPSPLNPPSGCVFHTRCPFATDRCKSEIPKLRDIKDNHKVACHYAEEEKQW